jgi:hypothetical protein
LNLAPGRTLPNMVIVPVGVDGNISIFNSDGNTGLLVDVLGFFPTNGATPPTTPPSTGPSRARVVGGPAGSEDFGSEDVLVLSNGNYVVTDPDFNAGSIEDVGAVYLFDGVTDRLISTLKGSTELDGVGSGGVFEVGTSDVVVVSPSWDNNGVGDGAVTWIDGSTGLNGPVSPANSLVSTDDGRVGAGGVTVLSNGNYVVSTPVWDDGTTGTFARGAVTLASGATGLVGTVGVGNSLVGSSTNDRVGDGGVTALSNGNYVIGSPDWKNGAVDNVGAVTLASGVSGLVGTVGVGNSLVGSTLDDAVGSGGVTALTNGNYVVSSPFWNDVGASDAGAVTWAPGATGLVGTVGVGNSLVGSRSGNAVGSGGVTALTNGNYVVSSPGWDNGVAADVGAVTRADGVTGLDGSVSSANSLIGVLAFDSVGSGGVVALTNGNYVVSSPRFDRFGFPVRSNVGAVTLGEGSAGVVGFIAAANSLIGAAAGDQVGSGGVTALTNGNYVVSSPLWDNAGVTAVGAVTWGPGATGLLGTVGVANSLIGTSALDSVGSGGVTALTDGNYVVSSPLWNNGTVVDVGAVTWADGSVGLVGVAGPANSLVGTSAFFNVGSRVSALPDGEYAVVNFRSVTLGPVGGVVGLVTDANSLTIAGIPNPPFNTFIPISVSDRFTAGNALLIGTLFSNAVVVFRPGL